MNEQIISLSAVSVALVPLVLAITQMTKGFFTDTRFIPVVSIFLGVVASFGVPHDTGAFFTAVQGVLIGLSASGLYSGAKATFSPY